MFASSFKDRFKSTSIEKLMNSKYKVLKFKSNQFEKVDDLISIEEPLEISIKFKITIAKFAG